MGVNRVQVGWRADIRLRDRVDRWAERLHSSRNEVITTLIEQGLDAMDSMDVHGGPAGAVEAEVTKTLSNGVAQRSPTGDPWPYEPSPAENENEQVPYDPLAHETVRADPWESTDPDPKRHWHRFTTRVPNTQTYDKGVRFALYRCECGETMHQKDRG